MDSKLIENELDNINFRIHALNVTMSASIARWVQDVSDWKDAVSVWKQDLDDLEMAISYYPSHSEKTHTEK